MALRAFWNVVGSAGQCDILEEDDVDGFNRDDVEGVDDVVDIEVDLPLRDLWVGGCIVVGGILPDWICWSLSLIR